MSDVTLGSVSDGKVVVSDANDDGIYNEGDAVSVERATGARLSISEYVNPALKELGITSPLSAGVRLNPLAQYVASLSGAERYANYGEASDMEDSIAAARLYAGKAGITPDETRIAEIEKKGYTKCHKRAILDGHMSAIDGEPPLLMENHITTARQYAEKAGITVNEADIAEMRKTGYTNGYKKTILNAEMYASRGDATLMNTWISSAREYGEIAGIPRETIDEAVKGATDRFKKLSKYRSSS